MQLLLNIRRLFVRSRLLTTLLVAIIGVTLWMVTLTSELSEFVLFRPLTVDRPAELVIPRWQVTHPLKPDVRLGWSGYDENTSFPYSSIESLGHMSGLASTFGFAPTSTRKVSVDEHLISVKGESVTGDYFSGLGLRPQIGRLLGRADAHAASGSAIVISDHLWNSLFFRSALAIGKVVFFHRVPYTIVGIGPRGFEGMAPGQPVDFWVPFERWDETAALVFDQTNWGITICGRLAPGRKPSDVEPELDLRVWNGFSVGTQAVDKHMLPPVLLIPGYRGINLLQKGLSRPIRAVITIAVLLVLGSLSNV